mgnify:CR=1 FL=1
MIAVVPLAGTWIEIHTHTHTHVVPLAGTWIEILLR